jgi:hypothetical protein
MTPEQIKWAICAAALAAIAGLSFYYGNGFGAGRVQAKWDAAALEWEQTRREAAEAHAAALAAAREQEQAWAEKNRKSEEENAKLQTQLARASRNAAAAARSLRDNGERITAALGPVPANTPDTSIRIARSATVSLGECGERVAAVAREHDQCERQRRALIGAWPQ